MSGQTYFTLVLAKQDFKFSCAHFLVFDAEHAELLHGHNYQVEVELSGPSLNEEGLLADMARTKARIRRACARLDNHTLVPQRSPHVTVDRRADHVEIRFLERRYRFPLEDVVLLDQVNTSVEVLARMLWQQLAEGLDEPGVEELAVSVSQTSGQSCWYRARIESR
ncbi:MAG: 6-carboxytetrahydropterin synthase [Acidobacteriota bacterium]